MSYNGGNEDTIIAEVGIHWSIYLLPAALTLILGLIYPALALIGAGWLVYELICAKSIELVVSSKRLHGKYGIVNIRQMDVLLNKVGDINVRKGILGRMLGYGDLEIRAGGGTFIFKKITDPETFRNTILNAADQMEEGRFARQSDRFENAIYQQTAMQMKAAEHIAGAVTGNRIPDREVSQIPQLKVSEPEFESGEPAILPTVPGERVIRKKIERPLWQEDSPILIKECFIEEVPGSHQLQVSMTIQNLCGTAIEALYLDIQGFDVLKEEKCFLKKIPILDLEIPTGKSYAISPIELPDTSIRRISVYVRHVVFADEHVWNYEGEEPLREIQTEQEPYSLEYRSDIEKLAAEHGLWERGILRYIYQPVYEENYWLCGCQQFNTGDSCTGCGVSKEVLQTVFQPERIEEQHQQRLKREAEERERIRQEQERQRAEEERIRQEQERQRAEEERIRREQEEEKRRLKKQREEQREEQMRQMVHQVQNQAGKLVGAVKSGADTLKDGTIKKTDSLKKAVSGQVDGLLDEARRENEKKNCPSCGSVNDGNAKFCTTCGKPIKNTADTTDNK